MKNTTYIILFCLLLSGCSSTKNNKPEPIDHAISSALVSFSISFDQSAPFIPDAPKVGDLCPQCNNPPGKCGVGKVGDGVICDTCLECNGDGIIDEEDLNKIFSEDICNDEECKCEVCECENCSLKNMQTENVNYITMYTSDGCVWCVKWEKEIQPQVEKMGIKVKKEKVNSGSVPRFELNLNNKKIKYTGYITLDTIKKHL